MSFDATRGWLAVRAFTLFLGVVLLPGISKVEWNEAESMTREEYVPRIKMSKHQVVGVASTLAL